MCALDENLVFVSFMRGAEVMRPDQTGGEIGRAAMPDEAGNALDWGVIRTSESG